MVPIRNEGIILEPAANPFESSSVFNPAVIRVGDMVHVFYRAMDPRDYSSIGHATFSPDLTLQSRLDQPVLTPEHYWEIHGLEDPRIVSIDGTYYLTYVAYDGHTAKVAYATSTDLVTFTKRGLITPAITYSQIRSLLSDQRLAPGYMHFAKYFLSHGGPTSTLIEKNAMCFPKKINGKFALLHRIYPGIQILYVDDFSELTTDYWLKYLGELNQWIVLDPMYPWEGETIAAGPPPIETELGWLLLYNGRSQAAGSPSYAVGAALLDLSDPRKVLGRLETPLFVPTEPWEKTGRVNNVVFATGTYLDGDRLYILYGAGDTRIGAKSLVLSDLLDALATKGSAFLAGP